MPIYKRGKTWWIDISAPNGERIRRSAGTEVREEAKRLHDKLKHDAWAESRLGQKPRATYQDVVVVWAKDQNFNGHTLSTILRALDKVFGNLYLDEITSAHINDFIEKNHHFKASSLNRYLNVLKSILNFAFRNEFIDRQIHVRTLRQQPPKIRFLTRAEAKKLIAACPPHLAVVVRFALLTGLRVGNISKLTWANVDIENGALKISAGEMKNHKMLLIPLCGEAIKLLQELKKATKSNYVFTNSHGKQFEHPAGELWKKVTKQAGFPDFRFHDLRHTWATWLIQSGVPLHVVRDLGGWSDYKVTLRYAHNPQIHLTDSIRKIRLLEQ